MDNLCQHPGCKKEATWYGPIGGYGTRCPEHAEKNALRNRLGRAKAKTPMILSLLKEESRSVSAIALDFAAICPEAAADPQNSNKVGSILSDLAHAKKITRVGHGFYRKRLYSDDPQNEVEICIRIPSKDAKDFESFVMSTAKRWNISKVRINYNPR